LNRHYADEHIFRSWEELFQHLTPEQLEAKGIKPTYKWLEVPREEGYERGEFRPIKTPSIVSSSSADEFEVD
jgi:hypothetical protein